MQSERVIDMASPQAVSQGDKVRLLADQWAHMRSEILQRENGVQQVILLSGTVTLAGLGLVFSKELSPKAVALTLIALTQVAVFLALRIILTGVLMGNVARYLGEIERKINRLVADQLFRWESDVGPHFNNDRKGSVYRLIVAQSALFSFVCLGILAAAVVSTYHVHGLFCALAISAMLLLEVAWAASFALRLATHDSCSAASSASGLDTSDGD